MGVWTRELRNWGIGEFREDRTGHGAWGRVGVWGCGSEDEWEWGSINNIEILNYVQTPKLTYVHTS